MYQLRAMQERDIPAVLAIQEESYAAEVLEDEAVIRSRLAACPHLAWAAEDVEGSAATCAYPSRLGKVTPLDGEFHSDGEADCLYLHDLAVARRAAGRGIGPALVRHNRSRPAASGCATRRWSRYRIRPVSGHAWATRPMTNSSRHRPATWPATRSRRCTWCAACTSKAHACATHRAHRNGARQAPISGTNIPVAATSPVRTPDWQAPCSASANDPTGTLQCW